MKKSTIDKYKQRAKELLSQMTVEEKIGLLCVDSKSIDRLNIPEYHWWNEGLHGVARAGVATVFPQAIGLSATFDASLMREVGECIATEGRAKYNAYSKEQDRKIYKGLTFWSPNINICRDPRWGRGQETFGEDPYLTATLATEFIKGIQGDDENYLKAAACVKHFVAHSGPEKGRHGFNSEVTKKDFYETYFPAFERCIKDAQVEGVMGAYNSVNDEICNASEKLIKKLLREKTGFDGYYVSDCGAIYDIYTAFERVATAPEAAALAIKSGCNLNCGIVYAALLVSLSENLVTEADIDEAVLPLLTTRLKLGLIDGEDCVFNDIPYTANDTEEHHALSRKATEESIVLLKNDGLLPLNENEIKSIAVVGPNADEKSVLLGNYNGTPSEYYTMLDGIREVFQNVKIFYSEACHVSSDRIESCAESNDRMSEAILAAQHSDVVIVCVGLIPGIEGEECEAFNSDLGGDKKDLKLPGYQNELIEKMIQTGKKVVVVNLSGSAIDLSVAEKANAIIQAWYPGMYGGLVLANILCGKCNPSGKLPVTFYKNGNALPAIDDYTMDGRTYKYFTGEPLYPFGFGLSYTTFAYSDFKMLESLADKTKVQVTIRNTGKYDGREIAQVYARNVLAGEKLPLQQLVGVKSVFLKAGESAKVEFILDKYWLSAVNSNGERVDPDACELFVGGGLPNENSLRVKCK
ncbi:MAG: glycoside hydrolase family 3 protein [Clostridiales bacterium]|nr:glycoside hydrolase family 3 protein [Clostridiales bacterium]